MGKKSRTEKKDSFLYFKFKLIVVQTLNSEAVWGAVNATHLRVCFFLKEKNVPFGRRTNEYLVFCEAKRTCRKCYAFTSIFSERKKNNY
jgi:hypothetical protein